MGNFQSLVLEPWPDTDISWPRFISSTGQNWILDIVFHVVIFTTSIILIGVYFHTWHNNVFQQSPPSAVTGITPAPFDASGVSTQLMVNFQVATANYGGIYTEQGRPYSGYCGRVDPLAVDDQINAGARALIFDVWPDPTNTTQPCVAIMEQNQGWWLNHGLTSGVTPSGFSNWRMITRNSVDLLTMLNATAAAAPGSDPFFVLLNLHGAMTIPYLNTIGNVIDTAFMGRHMSVEYTKGAAPTQLAKAQVSAFSGRIFVMANIIVDPAWTALPPVPNVPIPTGSSPQLIANTYAMAATRFAEQINLLSNYNATAVPAAQQNVFPITSVNTSTTTPVPPNSSSTFYVIQPSIGTLDTTNDTQYSGSTSFLSCLKNTGAQFVGVNMFDQGDSNTLASFVKNFRGSSFLPIGNAT